MPYLSVDKVLRKLMIAHNLKVKDNTPVYYMWSSKKPKVDKKTNLPKESFFLVDFENSVSEWYVTYVTTELNVYKATIDDITGDISIA